jgi:hypothetical protein
MASAAEARRQQIKDQNASNDVSVRMKQADQFLQNTATLQQSISKWGDAIQGMVSGSARTMA